MSKNTMINNALIVTMDEQQRVIPDGSILIKDGIIAKVWNNQPDSEAPPSPPPPLSEETVVIDGKNLIIMPGLVNTHGHAAMTLFRSYADDLPLMDWLNDKIWPAEERLTGEAVYWGTMLAILEMIKSGTTTFTDMYFFMDDIIRAVEESGIRAVLSRGLVGVAGNTEQALQDTRTMARDYHNAANGRIKIMLGPHAPYTCPPDFLKEVMALADTTGLPMQIHISETRGEVEESIEKYGKTPVKHLEELGLFRYQVIGAHCVHVNQEDIEILSRNGVRVAHNPGSNLKLASGIAPVGRMLEKGMKVGLGTDGAASNNNLDLFEEMQLAAMLHKGVNESPSLIPAGLALKMATAMGAEALFLTDTGMIKEGCRADLTGLNRHLPHLCPMHNVISHLVYSASGRDVELVMADGKILLQDGRPLTLDQEKIMFEAEKHARELVR